MGCHFTKTKRKPDGIELTTVTSLSSSSSSNGAIKRIRKQNGHTSPAVHPDEIDGGNGRVLRLQPPPPAPPPSPPSPRPLPTEAPTLEGERPSMFVQLAEDLEPADDDLPDEIIMTTLDDKHSISVSNVTIKPSAHALYRGQYSHQQTIPISDISVEDLDTELDTYNRYSGEIYPVQSTGTVNPAPTDILLPLRKQSNHNTKSDVKLNKADFDQSKTITSRTNLGQIHSNGKGSKTDSLKMDLESCKQKDSENKREETFISESEMPLKSDSTYMPRGIYNTEQVNSVPSRKRKLQRKKKNPDYTPRTTKTAAIDKDVYTVNHNSIKPNLKSRPISATSTGTFNSIQSSGSDNSKANTFDFERHDTQTSSIFSKTVTGTTPIDFKADSYNDQAELIDLDDIHDDDQYPTATDQNSTKKFIDPYYGLNPFHRPFKERSNDHINDLDIQLDGIKTGSSSSEINTKQKLLYSRYARRPQSETMLRMTGKPPLPPGARAKIRPSSETIRQPQTFSKYFTTDMDIH